MCDLYIGPLIICCTVWSERAHCWSIYNMMRPWQRGRAFDHISCLYLFEVGKVMWSVNLQNKTSIQRWPTGRWADFICKLNENAKRRPTACALCDDAKLHGQTTPEGNDQCTNRIGSLTNLLIRQCALKWHKLHKVLWLSIRREAYQLLFVIDHLKVLQWEKICARTVGKNKPLADSGFMTMTSSVAINKNTDTAVKCARPQHLLSVHTVSFTYASQSTWNQCFLHLQ